MHAASSFFHDRVRRIDYATARHLLDQNNAQQELIQRLMSENQQLQEMKRQKVPSIAAIHHSPIFLYLNLAPHFSLLFSSYRIKQSSVS
jgi:hypothetical protein